MKEVPEGRRKTSSAKHAFTGILLRLRAIGLEGRRPNPEASNTDSQASTRIQNGINRRRAFFESLQDKLG